MMTRMFAFPFLFALTGAIAFAQTAPKKPVSVSYENLIKCFPELENESLSFKVDLNLLKEVADKTFPTRDSVLRQRKVQYLDSERQLTNLILRTKTPPGRKKETELILQQVDAKGVVTDIKLTKNQSQNPKQEVINNFLLNSTIKSDESLYNDTKLNNVSATYSRNFNEVQEYDLMDRLYQRSISCEKRSDLGIICTCSKK
ncbi:hypothetical protein [Bdellovibrio bacteriovorus]|uniref:hypothetical protein n=1 Tax=Bdellovibrio bacteriovorus TaxID=959 RepID=UPI0020A2E006|nr:hypothetical protein [Bdellovibrio bacteriovorus]